MERKEGQRKEDLSGEKGSEILKKAKTLIRMDFGGTPQIPAIQKKMEENGIPCGPKSAEVILKLIDEQLEGCRKRVFPRIDEAIRRFESLEKGNTTGESLP
jgi:hypothetical protein